jgi:hypothetical protein
MADPGAPESGAPSDGGSPDARGLGDVIDVDFEIVERAILNDTEQGRAIQAAFIDHFGQFMVTTVRPLLRDIAADGGQPQLVVNGLAELIRSVADSIEFPLDHPRSGFPPQEADQPTA